MILTKREQVRQFMKWYESNLNDAGCEAAYALTESVWFAEYEKPMYKNYHSFRTARYHWLKFSKNNRKVLH
jgi:hypothetical protein